MDFRIESANWDIKGIPKRSDILDKLQLKDVIETKGIYRKAHLGQLPIPANSYLPGRRHPYPKKLSKWEAGTDQRRKWKLL